MLISSGQYSTQYNQMHMGKLRDGYVAVEATGRGHSSRSALVHIVQATSFGDVAKRIGSIRCLCNLKVTVLWKLVPRHNEGGTGRFLISCPNCRAQMGKIIKGEVAE